MGKGLGKQESTFWWGDICFDASNRAINSSSDTNSLVSVVF
ncbi:hypothetical protein M7I_2292 [Glarea lozoyensis 74030]|uniref:Uncharacterized protein n=1 Tax=Glarea lozoyensis (strain ATCC 74030 / MF5533) TaxID=1104152 RepID=H0EID7_GLAL7|nr:hypothetical protein M7I_2292 [Glarea lozoyensis 74030]